MPKGFAYNRKSILEKFDSEPTPGSRNVVNSGNLNLFITQRDEALQQQIDEIKTRFAEPPSEDGKYQLKCTLENGELVVFWELVSAGPNNLVGSAIVGEAIID